MERNNSLYNSILDELKTLEGLLPSYPVFLRKLSNILRNNMWEDMGDEFFLRFIQIMNATFSYLVSSMGEDISLLYDYISFIDKYISKFGVLFITLSQKLHSLALEILEYQLGIIINNQWKRINPLECEVTESDVSNNYQRDFFEVMDELWNGYLSAGIGGAVKPLKEYAGLIRGRKGVWTKEEDLTAPSLEAIKEHNIINRWTPEGKRYIYLVSDCNEEVCLEELRINDTSTDVTICTFNALDCRLADKILVLDFDNVSTQSIVDELCNQTNALTQKIIYDISVGKKPKVPIRNLSKYHPEMRKFVAPFVTRMLLKQICSAIFVPLDKDEDCNEALKKKCYGSFHAFALWCESKNIAGIQYPSTRMRLKNKMGTNLVLFDADSVIPDKNTIRTIRKER